MFTMSPATDIIPIRTAPTLSTVRISPTGIPTRGTKSRRRAGGGRRARGRWLEREVVGPISRPQRRRRHSSPAAKRPDPRSHSNSRCCPRMRNCNNRRRCRRKVSSSRNPSEAPCWNILSASGPSWRWRWWWWRAWFLLFWMSRRENPVEFLSGEVLFLMDRAVTLHVLNVLFSISHAFRFFFAN